jgi:hypothetical protein
MHVLIGKLFGHNLYKGTLCYKGITLLGHYAKQQQDFKKSEERVETDNMI